MNIGRAVGAQTADRTRTICQHVYSHGRSRGVLDQRSSAWVRMYACLRAMAASLKHAYRQLIEPQASGPSVALNAET